MPLIETVVPSAAQGPVAVIFGEVEQAMGRVPGGMQLYAASPALLAQQWQVLGYYARHPRLSFAFSAAVRMLVSQDNDCDYCIGFNAALLIDRCGWSAEQVAASKRDVDAAPLAAAEKALLRFVLRTVNARESARPGDIEALKKLGWTEGDILDAVALGARNVAVDIIFNTFQVENDA
jgi:AhpD family alkylhydroperoxidase